MGFENDVFVSYNHIDDKSPVEDQPGWITAFHRALETRLAIVLGKEVRIWRDKQLRGNDPFSDVIMEQLPRVAVLVSVVSPSYLNSTWCQRELRQFLQALVGVGGVRVVDRRRVFKVLKLPVPREREPEELQSALGYKFYTVDPDTGLELELMPSPTCSPYWTKLEELARDIAELVGTLEHETQGAPAPVEKDSARSVYVAATTTDLAERRDAIRRDLQSHGYTVLPDEELPPVASDCMAYVRTQLASCRLSVHLVGEKYGFIPEDSNQSVVALQHELAIERAAGGDFCRLIWMPPNLAARDERQHRFIEQLEADPRLHSGADLLKTAFEDFKSVLHLRLKPQAAPALSPTSGRKYVYVVCEQRDRRAVRPVIDLLFDQGFEVVSSVFDGDQTSILQDHKDNLVTCDGVLIYYGEGGELWLRSQLRELKKSPGYGRTKPMIAGVFLAPPFTEEKAGYRSHEAVVINGRPELSAALFEPFLSRVK